MARFVFVTGGVVSSLGKGVTAAALGALLQARGYSVRLRKLDPYLNMDPGTMSPNQHGEVFVTDDGTEADLDLGHYERFTDVSATRGDSTTSGRIYWDILSRERKGEFLGATIQVIPHVTNAIKDFIAAGENEVDFIICEIGGTIGDIEAQPFVEAARQFVAQRPRGHCAFVHLTLVPYIAAAGEVKTKPTQHSVKELRSMGIQPDVLLCRMEHPLDEGDRAKIAAFCNVRLSAVIPAYDVSSIYEVPLAYHAQGLDQEVLDVFGLSNDSSPDLSRWHGIVEGLRAPERHARIGIVGKYDLQDAYKSLAQALVHAGIATDAKVQVEWIDSTAVETDGADRHLAGVDAIIVPGGFGERGTEGKIAAIAYARTKKVPFLGICLGMQMAVVEASRSLLGIADATSSEFSGSGTHVIGRMTEWAKGNALEVRAADQDMGGSLRLGSYPAELRSGSRIADAYGCTRIDERHRHRYEMNPEYADRLEHVGLSVTGWSPDGKLPEAVEAADHPWFVGVQYHPELKSRPFSAHPLFVGLLSAALEAQGW